jgi:hypothetical protein
MTAIPASVVRAATSQPVVLAQAAGGESATIPLVLLCLGAAWLAVKTKGAQWPHISIGVAIGVLGANTFIGTLVHSVLDVLVQIAQQIGHAFTS